MAQVPGTMLETRMEPQLLASAWTNPGYCNDCEVKQINLSFPLSFSLPLSSLPAHFPLSPSPSVLLCISNKIHFLKTREEGGKIADKGSILTTNRKLLPSH